MGSFNQTCFLSNLAIEYGEDVAVNVLVETAPGMGSCSPYKNFYPAPVMFYGTYDDYGAVENGGGICQSYIQSEFARYKLLENGLDDVNKMTRAIDAEEIKFSNPGTFKRKLQGDQSAGIAIDLIMIKRIVLERLLNEFCYDRLDSTGMYKTVSYQMLVQQIPATIAEIKRYYKEERKLEEELRKVNGGPSLNLCHHRVPEQRNWHDEADLLHALSYHDRSVTHEFFGKTFGEYIGELAENNNDFVLTEVLKEFVKQFIINTYMFHSRRVYIKPNAAFQHVCTNAQAAMSRITLDVAEEMQRKHDLWEYELDEDYMEQCELEL